MFAGLNADERLLDMAQTEWDRIQNDTHWKKNTKFAADLADKQSKEHLLGDPSLKVAGYQQAGFSPLSALGQSVSVPVTSSGAPSQSLGSSSAGAGSQDVLSLAQSKLLLAQAEHQKIQNRRDINEDAGASQGIKELAQSKLASGELNPSGEAYWNSILERDDKSFNVGDYRAQQNFVSLVKSDVDKAVSIFKGEFEKQMWKAYKDGNLESTTLAKERAELGKAISSIAEVEAHAALMIGQTQLLPHEAAKLDAEFSKALAEADSIYHGDIAAMFANKDYQSIAAYASKEAFHAILDYGKFAGAKGLLKGAQDAKKVVNRRETKKLINNLDNVQKKNERIRKYVERRTQERFGQERFGKPQGRVIKLRHTAMPL